jgi:L-ascorbate metabolism protein UlaG (beta-lactamase superfamily)
MLTVRLQLIQTLLATVAVCLLCDAVQAQQHVRLTYLGTAGWEITDGKVVLLVDPYFSRVKRRIPYADVSADDPRPVMTDDDLLTSDRAVIDTHITRADFILITHTHSDHVMDTPYIAQKTGAIIIGTQSTTNFLRASGISNSQLITVKGGEDMDLGAFSVRVVPSLHGTFRRLPNRRERSGFNPPLPALFPANAKPPFHFSDLALDEGGGTLAYLVRLGGSQILVFGSMNYIEREVAGLHPDIAIVGALADRLDVYQYTARLLRALDYPPVVLPTHWDRFNVPFDMPQTSARNDLDSFISEVKAASPKTRVIVPAYFDPVELPLEHQQAPQQRYLHR